MSAFMTHVYYNIIKEIRHIKCKQFTINNVLKKDWRVSVLGAVFFMYFGGKIKNFQTDVNKKLSLSGKSCLSRCQTEIKN